MSDGLESRRAALDLIERVRGGEPLEDALAGAPAYMALAGSDRSFARALASNVMRRRGSIDHILGTYIERPLPKKSARVMDILRLAAAQSIFLETPDHAAVSTAVTLSSERRETAGYAILINAVARKVAANGESLLAKAPARADTPAWMWRSWERAYGPKKLRAIAEAHRKQAPLDISLRDPSEAPQWAERLEAEILPNGSLRRNGCGDVRSLPGFDEGAWWVQDLAASLPVMLLGDVAGKIVYDLCAAPGGKTMQLAARYATVTAVDRSETRLARLQENLTRTNLSATLVEEDALRWNPKEKADAILLDAPCSATGTLRRHPDIAWTKTETDIEALTALQAKMIDRSLGKLKPGGLLIYCVCSLQREEGEKQAEAVLARRENLERVAVEPDDIGGLSEAVDRNGDLRTLPSMLADKGGMDGFFAVRFRLKS
ncbi:MAG: methyltransferase domain-containing protein [Marinicaulis sp.]|nr:methyltransferase domain-containing protein [Marinicaulis sp.]